MDMPEIDLGDMPEIKPSTWQLTREALSEVFSFSNCVAGCGAAIFASLWGVNAYFALAFGLSVLILIAWLQDR
jgi:hypothetical protein